jgi:hypothetical protein
VGGTLERDSVGLDLGWKPLHRDRQGVLPFKGRGGI